MIFTTFYLLNLLLAFVILVITFIGPNNQLLASVSIENGPYEVATAAILLAGSLWLGLRAYRNKSSKIVRSGAIIMAALCFVGAGEEISWGQHWLHFESTEFFLKHNYQQEANLHNLIPAVIFSTLINIVLYSWFTLFPVLHWAYPDNAFSQLLKRHGIDIWIPTKPIALMMILASSFHAWLIPATYSDTAAVIACWLIALMVMIKRRALGNSLTEWIMLGLALAGFGICIWVSSIFRHHNMQYEIRECFTAYTIVFWALQWSRRAPNT